MRLRHACAVACAIALGTACEAPRTWQASATELDEALMSVSGTSERDVWAVGADTGQGPLVLHFDGTTWERRSTGTHGHLWWVHAVSEHAVFFGGARGTILEWDGAQFVRHVTPSLARQTVFGVWGVARDDVYAVGSGTSGRRGFLWHFDGTTWAEVTLPADVPRRQGEVPGLFKVWGSGPDDVWVVGGDGLVLHKDASGWQRRDLGRNDMLFTVHGHASEVWVVGGGREGVLLEGDGAQFQAVPVEVSLLQGVAAHPTQPHVAWAVGEQGAMFQRTAQGWAPVSHGLSVGVESLHAVWVDPTGGVWAVGGQVLTTLTRGTLLRLAAPGAPTYTPAPKPPPPTPECPASDVGPAEGQSVARRWNEQALAAVRRDLPRPTVHARNLYHLSAAMWDAWVAYGGTGTGVFSSEHHSAVDVEAARTEAVSYAAFRVLDARYRQAVGGPVSTACFRALMAKLGLPPDDATTQGDSPRAVGNRVAEAVLAATHDDGSNEANDYADTTHFEAHNLPLTVESASVPADDIDHWQPLDLAIAATQNGIPLAPGVQEYVGAHWGDVTPFALVRSTPDGLYVDPGPPPTLTPATMGWVVEVLQRSSQLGVDERTIDISPGAYGNNPLGSNEGHGRALNPVTGQPYAPQRVPLADFGRVMAEVWADGPKSETPPGHWNVLANQVADHPSFTRRWQGQGAELSRLEWDVRLYLALNGALHDAAIAAWQIKRRFTSSRPITLIRTCAAHGQSSDPALPSYDARGLPLVPGLIEVVTEASGAPGERHEALRASLGEVVVKTWRGEPGDTHQVAGIGWQRAVEWVPYQKRTFVTPAFPGFISGHSTFSRAGAEVLTLATGSEFFPGGLGELRIPAQSALSFEAGPSQPLVLQWASYADAADQAGQSRLWGGIHIEPDDFQGRRVGLSVGQAAFSKAQQLFQ